MQARVEFASAASYPGNAASVRSGSASFLGTLSRGSATEHFIFGRLTHGHLNHGLQLVALSRRDWNLLSWRFSPDAHLVPVDLPEIVSLTGSQGIEKIAWDASGERLAVSYKGGDDIYNGLIAIYDVRRAQLISVSLIGFIRGPGDNPKPVAFAFHDKFKQGPLLSVVEVVVSLPPDQVYFVGRVFSWNILQSIIHYN
ncbi:hypothetical protein Dsin_012166 [Dipteronia sinensis]|uniref:Uncharacterized protein n=1 Tax=Dipteronia sinensis TaxID=43782 RepID=A0AAE0E7S0_9ROSI|nr:hypothetical protein Dsin_012166 [Dipteronia sinensis]